MPTVIGKDQSVYKVITCKGCGAMNQYAPNEVRTIWSGKDYSGGSSGYKGFNCASCGKEVITEAW